MRKIFLFFSALLLLSNTLKAQNRTITGVVIGDKSETLPGVTIQIKGSTISASTDVNGKFSITATNLQSVVVTVKYIGYGYQEKTLRVGENNADFKLNPVANDLNEVIITGYGEQKKATLTGAISVVDLKKIEDIPNLNLTSILRGTVPGLSVSGGQNRPGQGTTVLVRNPVAFAKDGGQGTNPLFIIDDAIRTQTDFDLIDVSLVESVSVLKDAEAAIYGVQGANGVVIVRTKRGKTGAPKVSLNTSVGATGATMIPKMLNSTQLATFNNDYTQTSLYQQTVTGVPKNDYYDADGFKYTNGVKTADPRLATWFTPDEFDYFKDHSHNWLDEAFKTSLVERAALTISGGGDRTTYFVGGDYLNQNSNFKGINSYKYGVRANIETKPVKGLTLNMSITNDVSYSRSYFYKLNGIQEGLDNDAGTLLNMQPWQEYFINGNPVLLGTNLTGGYDNVNYFLVANSNNYTGSTNYIMNIQGKLTYEIPGIKGLTATASLNKNNNSTNSKQFGTTFNYYRYSGQGTNGHIPGGSLISVVPIKNGDRVRLNPTFSNTYQLNAGLNYSRTFGKHTVSLLSLFEQREASLEGVAAMTEGVIAGGLDYQTFTTGAQTSTQSGQLSDFGFQSFINRFNYSYDNKYLLQLVYRADASSRFPPGNKWGSFPSASVGWVVSEESFFKKNVKWMEYLKFRASIGLTGTDNSKGYQYLVSYNLGTGSAGGAVFNEGERSIAIKPNVAIANADVKWDSFVKTNYGVDMQFLKNRLTLSADYFYTHGFDMLTGLTSSVPATIGFTNVPTENFSKVDMFGYEISAGWRDHIGKKFTYSFSPFFAWSDNKNIKIDVAQGDIGGPVDLTGKSSDIGNFGYKSLGIIRTQAEADAIIASRAAAAGGAANVKIFNVPLQPGMINYEDVNGDGVISTDNKDKQYITKRQNNHNNLGLNWSVGYAGLNLNVVMGMSWGGWAAIDGLKPYNQSSSGANIQDNRPVYWADHWTKENTNAKYPAPYFQSNYQVTTDFWLIPATSFNVSSINLSYTIPAKVMSRLGIASARVFAVATNPIQFINPYPEGYRDFQTKLYEYPSLRTVSLGLNVGF